MSRQAFFRGIAVEVVQGRIRERKPDLFYYELRCPDDRWASPATIEEKVSVNFWGTLVSPQKIDFGGDDYLELTDAESSTLLVDDDERGAASS